MKRLLRALLVHTGYYQQLKFSGLFRLYEKLFKPAVRRAAKREVDFYRSFLDPVGLIFDIGANDGHKTEAFLQLAQKVVCCEPDATNLGILRTRFRNRKEAVYIEAAACGPVAGSQKFYVHHDGSAFNTLNPRFKEITQADDGSRWNETIRFSGEQEVTVTTLDALIQKHGLPGFIKIDVEGYELEVLRGLSQPVPCLSIECLFPEFRGELEQSINLLRQLDAACIFNIAMHEQLVLPAFVDAATFIKVLDSWKEPHFEVVVRMPAAYPVAAMHR